MTLTEWKKDFKEYLDALMLLRDDYRGILSYIDEAPANDGEWIPVTERLPEVRTPVLFCDDDGDMHYGFYDKSFYGGYPYWKEFYNDDRIKNVVAWMPSPESYREDGET